MNNALLARFLPEARDLIQTSERSLLRLEAAPDDGAAVNEVFRAFHTLKGSSGLFEVLALTRLMHAAEDVLGAIRGAHLSLDAELVDLLLDSLDQVKRWIDHLERHERLPDDADRASVGLVSDLRSRLKPEEAVEGDERTAGLARIARPDDFAALFSPEERFAAFERGLAGEAVFCVRYEPDEDCFFRGDDPLNLVAQVDGLIALKPEAKSAWPVLAELDPYRCNLSFTLLCASSEDALAHLFRYVPEQVLVTAVEADALLGGGTRLAPGPVAAQSLATIRAALAAGTVDGLSGLLDVSGLEGEQPATCGPWLAAALRTVPVNEALLTSIVPCIDAPDQPAVEPAAAEDDPTRMLRQLLGAQELTLRLRGFSQKRLASAATVLSRLSPHLKADDADALAKGVAAALKDGSPDPLLRVMARVAAGLPGKPLGRRAHDPVEMRLLQRFKKAPAETSALSKSLKVDPAKVDLLMNLIGELVVSKNALPFLAQKAEATSGARAFAGEVKELYAVFDRLTQGMQRAIMDVRMLPVSDVFDRFPRVIRDISRTLGKKIQLSIEGEETSADKTIVDALGDPLLHLIRNAIDHGVEDPEERRRLGKPEEATILLRAYQEADGIVIEIVDDGRGIDPAKIRNAAVEKGVVGLDRASRLSDQEALDLIFLPGFSTAREISDLSGRGVGMDVVRSAAESLGGKVSINSKIGSGTTIRLTLPLTMAVTRVIVIKVGDGLFGIPMDLVVETVRIRADQIAAIKTSESFVLRDRIIPLVRAARMLGKPELEPREEEAVLVCRVNGATMGLVIDDFRGSMDIILKPLDGLLAEIAAYAGTALLGDGSILLVLNLKELL